MKRDIMMQETQHSTISSNNSRDGRRSSVAGRRVSPFSWSRAQPLAIALAAGFGVFSGWMFGQGPLPLAWMLFLFGFVWVLMMSLGLSMWLAYRTRPARSDWRAVFHIGFASAFPLATMYFASVAALTWTINLTIITFPNGGRALSRPDYLHHFPMLYACSLFIALLSGPLFVRMLPEIPRRARDARQLPAADHKLEEQEAAQGEGADNKVVQDAVHG
jgi:hypothetical protein